jgi:ubiquinone/menaquinone biosynthesis C-methylase UbiE
MDYAGKNILDVGCGPRGSLEWASMARERVGIDSLISKYRALGIDRHAMKYVDAPAEKIPFGTGYFDFVTSFNSLDHVDDLEKAISEIARVTKPEGTFLLICEVNHEPTETEPVYVTQTQLKSMLSSSFKISSWRSYQTPPDHDIYLALKNQKPLGQISDDRNPVVIAAKMQSK